MEIPENKKQFEITEKFIGWGSAFVVQKPQRNKPL